LSAAQAPVAVVGANRSGRSSRADFLCYRQKSVVAAIMAPLVCSVPSAPSPQYRHDAPGPSCMPDLGASTEGGTWLALTLLAWLAGFRCDPRRSGARRNRWELCGGIGMGRAFSIRCGPRPVADQAGHCPEGGWAGGLADHRPEVARDGSGGYAGDVRLSLELAESAPGPPPRRELPAAVVPTLQDPTTGNRPPGGLFGASCERRASFVRLKNQGTSTNC
jgi:hypothetical protein